MRALSNNRIFGTPEWVLLITQTFSTISYAVLYSSLVLYMKQSMGMPQTEANAMMGLFVAFNYGLHLLGSYMGGRLMSYRGLFVIGMVLQVIACLLLALGGHYLLWGLASFLTGSGLNVPCINMMLTQQFTSDQIKRREKAFLWNYAGMNVGFVLGFSLAGSLQLHQAFVLLFILSSITNIAALVMILLGWGVVKDQSTPWMKALKTKSKAIQRAIWGVVVILIVFCAIRVLLTIPLATDVIGLAVGACMIGLFIYLSFKQKNKVDGQKLLAYVLLASFAMVFWSLYDIAPMGLTLFAQYNVQRHVMGVIIAPQWIQNTNSIVIAFGGFALPAIFRFIRKYCAFSLPAQFTVATFLMALGYLVLPLGIHYASAAGLSAIVWIILSYVFQSTGELLISPTGYAMVGQLATPKLQGLMMGSWMLLVGSTAGIIASFLSNWAVAHQTSHNPHITNASYSHAFLIMGIVCALTAVALMFMVPYIRKLTHIDSVDPKLAR